MLREENWHFVAETTRSCKTVTHGGIVRPFFLCSQEFMIAIGAAA